MAQRKFRVRDVCALLNVRPHVLRYWEREIPLLSPKKTVSGHRLYSFADIEILFRIRYLLYERGCGMAEIRERLWSETSAEYQDVKARISALRAELIGLSEITTGIRTHGNVRRGR